MKVSGNCVKNVLDAHSPLTYPRNTRFIITIWMFFDYNLSALWLQFDEQFIDTKQGPVKDEVFKLQISYTVDIFRIKFYAYIFCKSKFASVTLSTFRLIFFFTFI